MTETTCAEQRIGLSELLLQNEIYDWDVVLVGDGSGNQWEFGCGWACMLVERDNMRHKLFYGCASAGTNYTAELDACLRPLLWYSSGPGKELMARRLREHHGSVTIHIITDCEVLAKQGNGHMRRDKNKAIWLAVEEIASRGYLLVWHWMPRESSNLNHWADQQSKRMRLALRGIEEMLNEAQKTCYDVVQLKN